MDLKNVFRYEFLKKYENFKTNKFLCGKNISKKYVLFKHKF